MFGASKPLRPGMTLSLDDPAPAAAPTSATVLEVTGEVAILRFTGDDPGGVLAVAERLGEVPLPPYIERPPGDSAPEDRERYQTVFARVPGAAAAPTAGLHFTPELLAALHARGIDTAFVTLHVGLGTFAPLRLPAGGDVDALTELHAEPYEVPEATALAVDRARAAGRPIVAVGTTSVRTLESAAVAHSDDPGAPDADPAHLPRHWRLRPGRGLTRLFIKPGHPFRLVDRLITNFHLPRSTLLMLVAAFAGKERIVSAYLDAVARGYRFFSYGDAMLLDRAPDPCP